MNPVSVEKEGEDDWSKAEAVTAFCNRFAAAQGIRSVEEWHHVKLTDFKKFERGASLLRSRGSLPEILKVAYPKQEWFEWRFSKCPVSFWDSSLNRRRYVDWLGRQLGFTSLQDWYKVTVDDFFRHDGRSLLVEAFHSSPQELLKAVFPAINWKPWLFSRVPKNFYDKMENVRLHLDDIKAEAGVEDDGEVKMEHFAKFGGGALLARFNNSPQLVVEVAGGTYQSNKKPMNYWKNVENQKLFLEELARKLNIGKDEKEKWYDVDSEVVGKEGGATLLSHYYGGSMHALLKSVYPGYGWEPWRFRHVDQFAWKDKEVVLKAVKAAETKLGLSKKEDWGRVTSKQIQALGMGHLFKMNGGLATVLKLAYPECHWNPWQFSYSDPMIWQDIETVREAVELVEVQHGISKPEQWYNVTWQLLVGLGLRAVFEKNGGVAAVLSKIYPETEWLPWRFSAARKEDLSDMSTLLRGVHHAETKLEILQADDWYKVTQTQLKGLGLALLFESHGGLQEALRKVYPNIEWYPWRFVRVKKSNMDNGDLVEAVKFVEKTLGLERPQDWSFVPLFHIYYKYLISIRQRNRVNNQQLEELHIRAFFRKFGGVSAVLNKVYPDLAPNPKMETL